MPEIRYTAKQIMPVIAAHLVDMYGLDDDEALDPVADLDLRIDLYFKAIKLWDEFVCSDFMVRFESVFHFECSPDEWNELFGVACGYQTEEEWIEQIGQHLTFRALVEFIAARAPCISFQPVTVIDRECGPAGAFYGITELSEQVVPPACQITPATRIIDAFRGSALDRFWSGLNWRTEEQLPDISRKWEDLFLLGLLLGFLGILIGFPLSLVTASYSYVLVSIVYFLVNWILLWIYHHCSDPMPPELQTFRDLALLIADLDCEAVRGIKSDPLSEGEGLA